MPETPAACATDDCAAGARRSPRSRGLLRRDADRQALATLVAAPLEDLAPARRGHPSAEAMGTFSSPVAGLVGALHSFPLSAPEPAMPITSLWASQFRVAHAA